MKAGATTLLLVVAATLLLLSPACVFGSTSESESLTVSDSSVESVVAQIEGSDHLGDLDDVLQDIDDIPGSHPGEVAPAKKSQTHQSSLSTHVPRKQVVAEKKPRVHHSTKASKIARHSHPAVSDFEEKASASDSLDLGDSLDDGVGSDGESNNSVDDMSSKNEDDEGAEKVVKDIEGSASDVMSDIDDIPDEGENVVAPDQPPSFRTSTPSHPKMSSCKGRSDPMECLKALDWSASGDKTKKPRHHHHYSVPTLKKAHLRRKHVVETEPLTIDLKESDLVDDSLPKSAQAAAAKADQAERKIEKKKVGNGSAKFDREFQHDVKLGTKEAQEEDNDLWGDLDAQYGPEAKRKLRQEKGRPHTTHKAAAATGWNESWVSGHITKGKISGHPASVDMRERTSLDDSDDDGDDEDGEGEDDDDGEGEAEGEDKADDSDDFKSSKAVKPHDYVSNILTGVGKLEGEVKGWGEEEMKNKKMDGVATPVLSEKKKSKSLRKAAAQYQGKIASQEQVAEGNDDDGQILDPLQALSKGDDPIDSIKPEEEEDSLSLRVQEDMYNDPEMRSQSSTAHKVHHKAKDHHRHSKGNAHSHHHRNMHRHHVKAHHKKKGGAANGARDGDDVDDANSDVDPTSELQSFSSQLDETLKSTDASKDAIKKMNALAGKRKVVHKAPIAVEMDENPEANNGKEFDLSLNLEDDKEADVSDQTSTKPMEFDEDNIEAERPHRNVVRHNGHHARIKGKAKHARRHSRGAHNKHAIRKNKDAVPKGDDGLARLKRINADVSASPSTAPVAPRAIKGSKFGGKGNLAKFEGKMDFADAPVPDLDMNSSFAKLLSNTHLEDDEANIPPVTPLNIDPSDSVLPPLQHSSSNIDKNGRFIERHATHRPMHHNAKRNRHGDHSKKSDNGALVNKISQEFGSFDEVVPHHDAKASKDVDNQIAVAVKSGIARTKADTEKIDSMFEEFEEAVKKNQASGVAPSIKSDDPLLSLASGKDDPLQGILDDDKTSRDRKNAQPIAPHVKKLQTVDLAESNAKSISTNKAESHAKAKVEMLTRADSTADTKESHKLEKIELTKADKRLSSSIAAAEHGVFKAENTDDDHTKAMLSDAQRPLPDVDTSQPTLHADKKTLKLTEKMAESWGKEEMDQIKGLFSVEKGLPGDSDSDDSTDPSDDEPLLPTPKLEGSESSDDSSGGSGTVDGDHDDGSTSDAVDGNDAQKGTQPDASNPRQASHHKELHNEKRSVHKRSGAKKSHTMRSGGARSSSHHVAVNERAHQTGDAEAEAKSEGEAESEGEGEAETGGNDQVTVQPDHTPSSTKEDSDSLDNVFDPKLDAELKSAPFGLGKDVKDPFADPSGDGASDDNKKSTSSQNAKDDSNETDGSSSAEAEGDAEGVQEDMAESFDDSTKAAAATISSSVSSMDESLSDENSPADVDLSEKIVKKTVTAFPYKNWLPQLVLDYSFNRNMKTTPVKLKFPMRFSAFNPEDTTMVGGQGGVPILKAAKDKTSWGTSRVFGREQPVLEFKENSKLELDLDVDTDLREWSIVMIFRLDKMKGYRKLIDFSNLQDDWGLYNRDHKLVYYGMARADQKSIMGSQWIHMVITKNAKDEVAAYVNGKREPAGFLAHDEKKRCLLGKKLFFFTDDKLGSETSGGAIAQLRVFQGALVEEDVEYIVEKKLVFDPHNYLHPLPKEEKASFAADEEKDHGMGPLADYHFKHTLDSSTDAGQPLQGKVTDRSWSYEHISDFKWVSYVIAHRGLRLVPVGDTNSPDYTIAIMVRFDHVDGWRKIIDFKNMKSAVGLYVHDGKVEFYSKGKMKISSTALDASVHVRPGHWYQIVFVRTAGGAISCYVDGESIFSTIPDSQLLATPDPVFYIMAKDMHANDISEKEPAGIIARLRYWDRGLMDNEVRNLRQLPANAPRWGKHGHDGHGVHWMDYPKGQYSLPKSHKGSQHAARGYHPTYHVCKQKLKDGTCAEYYKYRGFQSLYADYQFYNTLASVTSGAPPLHGHTSSNKFVMDKVRDDKIMVYRFQHGAGLNTEHTPMANTYTLAMLFRLDSTHGYKKIIDFKGLRHDEGIYVHDGRLLMHGYKTSGDLEYTPLASSRTRDPHQLPPTQVHRDSVLGGPAAVAGSPPCTSTVHLTYAVYETNYKTNPHDSYEDLMRKSHSGKMVCEKPSLPSFASFSSQTTCGGPPKNLGYEASTTFNLCAPRRIRFRACMSFGRGGLLALDGKIVSDYRGKARRCISGSADAMLTHWVTLAAGSHTFSAVGFDDNNGNAVQRIEYQLDTPGGGWQPVSKDDMDTKLSSDPTDVSLSLSIHQIPYHLQPADTLEKALGVSQTGNAVCTKELSSLHRYGSQHTCRGPNNKLAYEITIFMNVVRARRMKFRIGGDFGNGVIVASDEDVLIKRTVDHYWGNNWNKALHTHWINMKPGHHTLTVVGFENCCDGVGSIEFMSDVQPNAWLPADKGHLKKVLDPSKADAKLPAHKHSGGTAPKIQLSIHHHKYRMHSTDSLSVARREAQKGGLICEKQLDIASKYSSQSTCHGPNRDLSYDLRFTFGLDKNIRVRFRVGGDYGHGGLVEVDNTIKVLHTRDHWWGGHWSKALHTHWMILNRGQHEFETIGFEGCCDGAASIQFQLNGQNWKDLSLDNWSSALGSYRGHSSPIPSSRHAARHHRVQQHTCSMHVSIHKNKNRYHKNNSVRTLRHDAAAGPVVCSKDFDTLQKFSSQINCGGPNRDIAYHVTFNFSLKQKRRVRFRGGADFGRGGAMLIDGRVSTDRNHNFYWGGHSAHNWVKALHSEWLDLDAGQHKLEMIGFEDCCDGPGGLQFEIDSTMRWTYLTKSNWLHAVNKTPRPVSLHVAIRQSTFTPNSQGSDSYQRYIQETRKGNLICEKSVDSFVNIASHTTCGAGKRNLQYILNAVFTTNFRRKIRFRVGMDYGRGGMVAVDHDIVAFSRGYWWAHHWERALKTHWKTIDPGQHTMTSIGFEDCCDGTGSVQFQLDSESAPWQDMIVSRLEAALVQQPSLELELLEEDDVAIPAETSEGPPMAFTEGSYHQVVVSRDHRGILSGYLDGLLQFRLHDTKNLAVADNGVFHFLQDDNADDSGKSESAGGAIARLRMYTDALTPVDVKGLNEVAPAQRLQFMTRFRVQRKMTVADYNFDHTLSSRQGGAPALNPLHAGNSWNNEAVDGVVVTTYHVRALNGLSVSFAPIEMLRDEYSIVLLLRLDTVNSLYWTKLVDFKKGTERNGFYVGGGSIRFGNLAHSYAGSVRAGTWHQLVLTRDRGALVRGYVDGKLRFQFHDGHSSAVPVNGELRFLSGQWNGAPASAVQLARIRVLSKALPPDQVAKLDRLYFSNPRRGDGTHCANDCYGNGSCINGKCVCLDGFAGYDCSKHVEKLSCTNNCSGRGNCVLGKCQCHEGFVGTDCSKVEGDRMGFRHQQRHHAVTAHSSDLVLVADYRFTHYSMMSSAASLDGSAAHAAMPLFNGPSGVHESSSAEETFANFEYRTTDSNRAAAMVYKFGGSHGGLLLEQVATSTEYTLVFLVKVVENHGWRKLVDFSGFKVDDGLYSVDGAIEFVGAPTVSPTKSKATVLSSHKWHQVVIARSANREVRVYCDGIKVFSFADHTNAAKPHEGSFWLFMDNRKTKSANAEGWLARIRIYNKALSDDQVGDLSRVNALQTHFAGTCPAWCTQSGSAECRDDKCVCRASFKGDDCLPGYPMTPQQMHFAFSPPQASTKASGASQWHDTDSEDLPPLQKAEEKFIKSNPGKPVKAPPQAPAQFHRSPHSRLTPATNEHPTVAQADEAAEIHLDRHTRHGKSNVVVTPKRFCMCHVKQPHEKLPKGTKGIHVMTMGNKACLCFKRKAGALPGETADLREGRVFVKGRPGPSVRPTFVAKGPVPSGIGRRVMLPKKFDIMRTGGKKPDWYKKAYNQAVHEHSGGKPREFVGSQRDGGNLNGTLNTAMPDWMLRWARGDDGSDDDDMMDDVTWHVSDMENLSPVFEKLLHWTNDKYNKSMDDVREQERIQDVADQAPDLAENTRHSWSESISNADRDSMANAALEMPDVFGSALTDKDELGETIVSSVFDQAGEAVDKNLKTITVAPDHPSDKPPE